MIKTKHYDQDEDIMYVFVFAILNFYDQENKIISYFVMLNFYDQENKTQLNIYDQENKTSHQLAIYHS